MSLDSQCMLRRKNEFEVQKRLFTPGKMCQVAMGWF